MTGKFENVGFNAAYVRVEETGDHAYVQRHSLRCKKEVLKRMVL